MRPMNTSPASVAAGGSTATSPGRISFSLTIAVLGPFAFVEGAPDPPLDAVVERTAHEFHQHLDLADLVIAEPLQTLDPLCCSVSTCFCSVATEL
jgi:hypothetical protein